MEKSLEFMYCGASVVVNLTPKAVIVNFFGRPLQFAAIGDSLRTRVREEIARAGLSEHLNRILTGSVRKARSK